MPGPQSLLTCAVSAFLLTACSVNSSATNPLPSEDPGALETPRPAQPVDRECSASRVMLNIGEQDLPEPVAGMRQQLVVSALTCDFEELGQLALAGDPEFNYSFGEQATTPESYWRELERTGRQEPLANLIRVLSLPPATVEVGDGAAGIVYVWPAVAAEQSPTEDGWEALADVFDSDSVARMQRDFEKFELGYLGWRVGIKANGDWVYYLTGD